MFIDKLCMPRSSLMARERRQSYEGKAQERPAACNEICTDYSERMTGVLWAWSLTTGNHMQLKATTL